MNPEVKLSKIDGQKAEKGIIEVLAYFDIFQYPLTEKEIKKFLSHKTSEERFKLAINGLMTDRIIFQVDHYFSLQNDQQLAVRRVKGNLRAEKFHLKAARIGAFLYKFPYVRAVAVSGSLSKDYVDEKGDIDFFIITSANRLWIARTAMHIFKKFTFLLGRQRLYCMNYYIDEEALVIDERNIYTAVEIVTLSPLGGSACIKDFFQANIWAYERFPGFFAEQNLKISDSGSWVKNFSEWLLNKSTGDWIDNFLFKWSTRRWKKKELRGRKNIKGKIMGLITGKHFAKSNPESFQERLIALYENRIEELKKQWPQYFQ